MITIKVTYLDLNNMMTEKEIIIKDWYNFYNDCNSVGVNMKAILKVEVVPIKEDDLNISSSTNY